MEDRNGREGRGQGPASGDGGIAGLALAFIALCSLAAVTLLGNDGRTAGYRPQPVDGALRLHEERCGRLRESGSPFDGTSAGLAEAIDCRDVFGKDVFAEACRAFNEKGTPYLWPDERQLCPRKDGVYASGRR